MTKSNFGLCKNRKSSPKITGDNPFDFKLDFVCENKSSLLINHGPLISFPVDPTNKTPARIKIFQPRSIVSLENLFTTELRGQQSENEVGREDYHLRLTHLLRQTKTKLRMSRDYRRIEMTQIYF